LTAFWKPDGALSRRKLGKFIPRFRFRFLLSNHKLLIPSIQLCQPTKDFLTITVYRWHEHDLLRLFVVVQLVDTDCIIPEEKSASHGPPRQILGPADTISPGIYDSIRLWVREAKLVGKNYIDEIIGGFVVKRGPLFACVFGGDRYWRG
jgi:hypothetical protein